MDPFSLAAGIAGLVSLVGQTLKVVETYIHDARHGKEAAAELSKELNVLNFNLTRLDKFLRSGNEAIQSFEDTSVLISSTTACRNKLNLLHDKLSSANESLKSRLRWPFDAKEHHKTINELRAFAQWVQFALTIDGCALLSKTSAEVLQTLKIQLDGFQLLDKIDDQTQSIQNSLVEHAQTLKDELASEEREKILDWISTFKHEQKHHAIRMPRIESTGEWLIRKNEFERWRDEPQSSNNVLWCYGIQGSGKSVLTSLVIDRLRDTFLCQNVAVLYLYFDFRDQEYQSTEDTIANLLKQLSIAKPKLPDSVLKLYRRLKSQQRSAQQQELEEAILLTSEDFDRVFIVIDALDECDANSHRKGFMKFLDTLQRNSSISIFVTSRYLEEFRKAFENSQKIVIGADDLDLKMYLSREIETCDNADIIDETFKNDIIQWVSQGAQKMFLLAVLQIQAILNEPTAGEMEEALEKLPHGLNGAFEETLQRIQRQPEGRKRLGMNTLMWVSHVKRPLHVEELSDALAVKMGEASLNPKYRPSQKLMVDCCLGLVTVDKESSIVRLVHYSVQEFFQEHQEQIFPHSEQTIAEISITYLLFDHFGSGCLNDKSEILALMSKYPFVVYAARCWGSHVRNACSGSTNELALKFLKAGPQRAFSSQVSQIAQGRRFEYWEAKEANSRNGLHFAASFGLETLGKQLLDSGEIDVDSATNMGTTALIAAASRGQKGFMQMLLSRNADPLRKNWYGTALHCAAESGELSTIQELLRIGLDVNIKDGDGRTSLHCATLSGHTSAMQVLMEQGADVDAKCIGDWTALGYAIVLTHQLEAVRILLANGASTGNLFITGDTVIHKATIMGFLDVLQLLLDYGADVNVKDLNGMTALHYATIYGVLPITRALLDHGANIDAQALDGSTPLYWAVKVGDEQCLRLLWDRGAKIETYDEDDVSSPVVVAEEKNKDTMKILVDARDSLRG